MPGPGGCWIPKASTGLPRLETGEGFPPAEAVTTCLLLMITVFSCEPRATTPDGNKVFATSDLAKGSGTYNDVCNPRGSHDVESIYGTMDRGILRVHR
jgi:hypothetical protein